MPRTAKPLTDAMVRNAKTKPGEGRRELSDGGAPGLVLRVSSNGQKVWMVRTRIAGRRHRHELGAYPTVGLGEARQRATEYASAAKDGLDPAAVERKREAANMTLANAHVKYLTAMEGRATERWIGLKRRMFADHVKAKLGAKPIRQIARADLIELGHDVARRGYKTQANRVVSEVMACLRWCAKHDWIESVPTLGKHARQKETPRDRTLTETEIADLWNGLDRLSPLAADFLRVLILTGQRRDEVRLMHASEIDTAEKVWTIPAERYKTGRAHTVPLNEEAFEIIQRRLADTPRGYLLPGREGDHKPYNCARNAMQQLRKAVPSAAGYTLHDIRRTVRTGLARLGVSVDVAEAVIGHAPHGILRVYDRHDRQEEKRAALQRWADYVLSTAGAKGDNVVPFTGAEQASAG